MQGAIGWDGGTRPSILAHRVDAPSGSLWPIFADDDYRFVQRGCGSSRDPGGNTEPGLFVHSLELDRSIQITAIETFGGQFGTSHSDDPAARRILMLFPVGWDDRKLASEDYAALPLRTTGSIVFPDSIHYRDALERYELLFHTSVGVRSAMTVLHVSLADLELAFAKR